MEGCNVSAFLAEVRTCRRAGQALDPTLVATLEAIPGWVWDPRIDAQQQMLGLLRRVLSRRRGRAAAVVDELATLGGWLMKARRGGQADEDLLSLPGWDRFVEAPRRRP